MVTTTQFGAALGDCEDVPAIPFQLQGDRGLEGRAPSPRLRQARRSERPAPRSLRRSRSRRPRVIPGAGRRSRPRTRRLRGAAVIPDASSHTPMPSTRSASSSKATQQKRPPGRMIRAISAMAAGLSGAYCSASTVITASVAAVWSPVEANEPCRKLARFDKPRAVARSVARSMPIGDRSMPIRRAPVSFAAHSPGRQSRKQRRRARRRSRQPARRSTSAGARGEGS